MFILTFFCSLLVYPLPYWLVDCFCSDAEVRTNALKSFLLNGISLLSIYVFDLLLHPLSRRGDESRDGARVQSQNVNTLHRSIGWLYRIFWLLPVVGVSLYLNVRNICILPRQAKLGQGAKWSPGGRGVAYIYFHFCTVGLVVLSYCQAHFYPAAWSRVPLCWNDIDHVAERVYRVPQLAGYVCLPCCHDRDVRLCLLCAGLCTRCWQRGRNHLFLLGQCVSDRLDSLTYFISHLTV